MDNSEAIIEAVRRKEVLWNSNNRHYKDLRLKHNEWIKIAEEVNMSVDIVKKRWRSLRDNYMRNLNKRKVSGQASDDEEQIIGKYTLQLQFLKDHMKPRKTGNYVQNVVEEESWTTSTPTSPPSWEIESVFEFTNPDEEDEVDALSSTPSNTLPSPCKTPKRRMLTHHTTKTEETLSQTMPTIQEFASKPRSSQSILIQPYLPAASNNSEDELFCRSLIQKLASFPVDIRNNTKLEMLRYVNQVEEDLLFNQSKPRKNSIG